MGLEPALHWGHPLLKAPGQWMCLVPGPLQLGHQMLAGAGWGLFVGERARVMETVHLPC